MAQKDLPDALSELRPIIQDYFGSDFRGTLLTDLLSTGASDDGSEIPAFRNSDPTVLPDNIYTKLLACINREPGPAHFISYRSPPSHLAQFLEPQAQYRKSIRYRGIVFATAAQHTGNSYVLFRKYPGGNACAGQIHQIFVHSRTSKDGQLRTEFFYVIRPLLALDSDQAAHDPYRFFALLDTQLYKDEFDPEEVVVRTTDIVSHFASCPYENPEMQGKYRVVVSLDRVSTKLYDVFVCRAQRLVCQN
ncbi:hypothetical protein BJ138DRAFT_566339 [Hygrophoropsis aurantiaca]|uniref:Uncharacterized protein n=1 Tax=Hygrophoropsis aurantiaca TaxID=72124 RepID=A0ACB8A1M8_9AGAM|nr:hypothetical protein BJ138DRAFT_566339 [Hygrophoropsis aurantiaca]